MNTIPTILEANAALWPDRPAIIETHGHHDTPISFAELDRAARNFAATLQQRGIQKADPVLVLVPVSIDLYITLLGIFHLGAIAVFLDPSAGRAHVSACCKMLPPRALVSGWQTRLLRPFVRGLRRIPVTLKPHRDTATVPAVESPAVAADAALITFTSGSTGQPKAAVRTHAFLLAQHAALRDALTLVPGEIDLTTLPIFTLANLASGITTILPDSDLKRPGHIDGKDLSRQIERLRPTRSCGSPAFYARLADANALGHFKKIHTGGAPIFPGLLERLHHAAPAAQVVAVYGSTEAEPIAHVDFADIHPADWEAMRGGRGLLAGPPVPEIQLRIIPDQSGQPVIDTTELPTNSPGEIVVTGPHVLQGYLHGIGNAETKFPLDNAIWHRTGDAGYLDGTSRLWLLGRCSARVTDAHGTIYPFAIECVAHTFPFVRQAAFVLHKGVRTLALELSDPKADLTPLRTTLDWAKIESLRVLPILPLDTRHNAKINYPKLHEVLNEA